MVLASGHLHVSETWIVFEEAQRRGVKRLVFTHPEDIVDASLNDVKGIAAMGAFVVIESREHAEKRGAKPLARLVSVQSSRNLRKTGESETTLRAEFDVIAPSVKKDSAVVISGASGAEPATSEEKKVLSETGLPVRATATHIGNGMEAQFLANIALGCQAVRKGTLFPPSGSGDSGDAPAKGISQALVTSVGHWRGEGLALIERIE